MRMHKSTALVIMLLVMNILLGAEKIGTFSDDYFKMPILRVDDNRVFVIDKGLLKGFIYDKKNLRKISEFGGKGQGPAEFTAINHAAVDEKYIYVTAHHKLCIFSKEGKFIREHKAPIKTGAFIPLGNNHYVGTYYVPTNRQGTRIAYQYRLFDENLEQKKSFFTSEFHSYVQILTGKEKIFMFRDCIGSTVYNNRIYVGNTDKGFHFTVFDQNGEKLYDIKRDVQPKILSAKEKEKIKDHLIGSGAVRIPKHHVNSELVIRDAIPVYTAFFVTDERIYVFSFPKSPGVFDIWILDLKGKLIKKIQKPLAEIGSADLNLNCVNKGKFYMLKPGSGFFDDDIELHEISLLTP